MTFLSCIRKTLLLYSLEKIGLAKSIQERIWSPNVGNIYWQDEWTFLVPEKVFENQDETKWREPVLTILMAIEW